MATTGICGHTGTVSLGGEITRWTLTLRQEAVDATSMASGGFAEAVACLKDATFEFDTLIPCGVVGASAGLSFTNDDGTWTFDAIIQSVRYSTSVEGVATYTYSGVSTGEIT